MRFEPEDAEEELYALRAALEGTRSTTRGMGCIGLFFSGMVVLFGGVMPLLAGAGAGGLVLTVVYGGMGLLYAIPPALLVAASFQRAKDLEDIGPAIRQARLLTVFWWISAVGMLGALALWVAAFVLSFTLTRF